MSFEKLLDDPKKGEEMENGKWKTIKMMTLQFKLSKKTEIRLDIVRCNASACKIDLTRIPSRRNFVQITFIPVKLNLKCI
jgi:hypothetical protein